MYHLLASDMDETFIGHDHTVNPKNLEAVAAMRDAGCKFVVATGRPYVSVQGTLDQLGQKGDPDEYCITYNGGYVCACDGRVLASHTLDTDVADLLYKFGEDRGLCLHTYIEDDCLIGHITEAEKAYLDHRMEVGDMTGKLPSDLGTPVYKVLFHSTDMDLLERVEAELRAAYPDIVDNLEVTYSANRYLEFNPKGVSKGAALLELAGLLGHDGSETVAVGDSTNDLSMLEMAGLGLAVANRSDSIAEAIDAEHTLESTCDDGAIWEVWERYVKPANTAL